MTTVTSIQPKHTLLEYINVEAIKRDIINILQGKIPNLSQFKTDLETLTYTALLVETKYRQGTESQRINLVIDIFSEIFSLTDDEEKAMIPVLTFLYNHEIVKVPKKVKTLYRYFKSQMSHFFLLK